MLDLQQINSFLAVVRHGSFVSAAEATNLSKAAISRHVADLEAHLGLRLLHRTTRRLSLTEDGQRFHARAVELAAALDELETETVSHGGHAVGMLRINAPLSFGLLHLAPLWPRFLAANPNVSLDIDLNDRIVDLVDEGYDLAIRITNLPDSRLISRQLASTRMALCASPQYVEKHGRPKTPEDLANHHIVSYSYLTSKDDWRFAGPHGEVRVRVNPRIRTNSGDTCRLAALAHQGIILQPDFLIGEDLKQGTLVELMPGYDAFTLGIHVVYASRKHMSLKMRRMLDFLVNAFESPSWV